MYGFDSTFWLKLLPLLLILTVYFVLMISFNAIMRRWLGVEKRKAFSHNHVNDKHKKIDWSIRLFFIAMMVIGGFINVTIIPREPYLFLQPWFLLFVLIFITETVRAVMEKRYAKNPNAYIFTVYQLVFTLILLILLYTTDFFGIL
ncbi:DUF4181 domain-containing protein [Paenisporosarcina sp. TG-14]|uniref:DUF4181 domain-containing protein n=1 Tax=Paenisporosarcina sp. TG-14 TaxID=1231057 RepID=UPI0003640D4A|nr:DUF4181 domain-containing protein [Paenisporosarcina sp. TG-14]